MKAEFLVVKIDEQNYGIDVKQIEQIFSADTKVKREENSDFILGIVNGNTKVVSLRKIFGIEETEQYKMIQIRSEQNFCLTVDKIDGIIAVEEEQLISLLNKTWIDSIFCSGFQDEQNIVLNINSLEIEKILGSA